MHYVCYKLNTVTMSNPIAIGIGTVYMDPRMKVH